MGAELAGTFESQSEMVMVEDRKKLEGLRGVLHGYVPLTKTQRNILSVIEKQAFFHRRYDCEEDELLRQFIPYVIVFGPDETVHQYRRKAIPKKDKEHRLYNRLSIGHGGHVLQSDGPDYIANAALRSLKEELSFEGDPESGTGIKSAFFLLSPAQKMDFGMARTGVLGSKFHDTFWEGAKPL